jgi:uncharacterized damage-inducible protein DinB
MATLDQILEAWRTNGRINELLIDAISEEGMGSTLSTRGGRSVARQFAHLHNIRFWQLEHRASELCEGLHKFETQEEPSKERLKECLAASGACVERFFEQVTAGLPRRRAFKKGPVVHLAYFIAHESHHRGNILLTLKQSGHPIDKAVRYKIWDWDRV